MKKLLSLLFVIIAIYSCEKDDFCLEETTPKLIIRFLDFTDQSSFKEITLESISADALGSYTGGNVTSQTDSIAIPLNYLANQTTYFIKKENEATEELEISYARENVFLSRSCGFKTDFNNLNVNQLTNHWIQQIQIQNSSVNNEQDAHLYIFH